MKNKSTNKSTNTNIYTKVAKNVYKTGSGSYRVRKMINGTKVDKCFTNRATAIKYAKSL